MAGYIPVIRESLNKFKGNVRNLLFNILAECNYSDNPNFEFNFKSLPLKRGQWVTSKKNISELTGLTTQEIKTALKKLTLLKIIKISSTNPLTKKATLITLINPDLFLHKKEIATNTATNNQQKNNGTEMQPTNNQHCNQPEKSAKPFKH